MNKILKRISAVVLVAIMLFGAVPLGTFNFATEANAETFNDINYKINNGEVTITICDEFSVYGDIVIPEKISGYPVTALGDSAFKYCCITSIVIPDSVKSIGDEAFKDCSVLESVTIGSGVVTIGKMAFDSCEKLKSITIPDNVKSISKGAFEYCTNLTSVKIGKGITCINDYTFYRCESLTNVEIGINVTSIEDYVFQYCESLESITIPDNVTSIGYDAFDSCKKLKSIVIPVSVKNIDDYAFSDCKRLSDVYYLGTEAQWKAIKRSIYYDALLDATIHYNYVPHVHSYTASVIKSPTCIENGTTKYVCSCGDTYNETVRATGHKYTDRTIAPTCTEKGYTIHTCFCGYSYNDSYVDAKGHTDGECKITKIATKKETGEKIIYCKDCQSVIRTEVIPKIPGMVTSVSINDIEVNYKSSATIKPDVKTEDEVKYTVKYDTSNPKVVTVDDNGNITTYGKGTATITCTVTDEGGNVVKDTCTVNVKFSFGQWLIWILLLGFLWY